MLPLRWKLSLLITFATLVYLGCMVTLFLGSFETQAASRNPGKGIRRSLARSSRSSSTGSSRAPRRPVPQVQSAASQSARRAPQQEASSQWRRPSSETSQHPSTQQHPSSGAATSPQPPPPAYPYNSTGASHSSHTPQSQPSVPAQGAPVPSPLQANGHPPSQAEANTAAVASDTRGPSLARTAVTSAVGAAVGSMVGTAVANRLSHSSGSPAEVSDIDTTSKQPDTSKLADGTETSTSTQKSTLSSRASVRLVFSGVGEQELQSNLRGAQSFGSSVQEAVVRSLGVAPGRIVLQDVLVSPGTSEAEPSKVVVTLSLLPDEGLQATEPSAQEVADEINRQLSQSTSYLSRELRSAFPQLPTPIVEASGAKATVLSSTKPEASLASSAGPSVLFGILCAILAGTFASH